MLKNSIIVSIIIVFTLPMLATEKNYTCFDKWPEATPPYHFTPNGCGPDSSLADLIPNQFGSVNLGDSCNKHDRCWMELEDINQYGRCEALFTKDLIKACSTAKKCLNTPWGRHCIPNPIEIAACESLIVPSFSGTASTSVLFMRLKKAREEQKEFEECVSKYGYNKREEE